MYLKVMRLGRQALMRLTRAAGRREAVTGTTVPGHACSMVRSGLNQDRGIIELVVQSASAGINMRP